MLPSLFFVLLILNVFCPSIASSSASIRSTGPGYLVWACNTILSNSSCVGVVTYSGNKVNQITDLKGRVSEVLGFAVDPIGQKGYLLAGSNRSNISTISVNLATGTYSFSSNPISLPSKNKVLDVAFDSTTGFLFLIVNNYYLLPSLGNLELQQLDPKTGKISTVMTVQLSDTLYSYFSSSLSKSGNYYLVLANETGFWLFNFNIRTKTVSTVSAPYGFVGTVFNEKNSNLLGNVVAYYNGTNTLASFDPSSGSFTYATNSLNSLYCGAAIAHAGLDVTSNYYYTLCCNDPSDCSNASLVVLDITNSMIQNRVPLIPAQTVNFGLFWVPSSKK